MKRCVLGIVLAAMLLPAAALCQEWKEQAENPEWQMEMQQRKMDLEARRAKMETERRMGELELAKRKMELARMDKGRREGLGPLLLLGFIVVHILCAVWVFQDIRQRACGSGIWIVIALLAGLFGTLVYAVVRLGNAENGKKKA